MAHALRNATAMAVMVFAAVSQPPAMAAQSRPGTKETQAEVQISLCAPTDRIVQALDPRPRKAPIEVWLFDDAALTLFERGLRLRLRKGADDRSEFTLKVANQDCARLDPKFLPQREGKCEYDAYGTSMAGAVSLTRTLDAMSTNHLVAGRVAPAQVLSPSQIAYLRDVVGLWPLPSGIRGLGPMQVRVYRTKGEPYDIDLSQLPGGERYAEISRKVPLADVARTREAMEAYLSRAGVEICADQSSQAVNKLRFLLR
jgi:hypothetical protein